MTAVDSLILASYFFVLLILAVYGWHRYYLGIIKHETQARSRSRRAPSTSCPSSPSNSRSTTRYVVDRLVDAVCQIEYPREKLEIQVLDDSTDETRQIAELAVRRHAMQGIDITSTARIAPASRPAR